MGTHKRTTGAKPDHKPDSINIDAIRDRIEDLLTTQANRYRRLWSYYENPILPRTRLRDEQGSDRPYRQGQEWGLPSRLTGMRTFSDAAPEAGTEVEGVARKEVVIENDIAWRIDVMVDFLVGKSISVSSLCENSALRAKIDLILNEVFQQHGGEVFFQQLALLAAVYGFVDVLVKLDLQELENLRHNPTRDERARASLPGSDGEESSPTPDGKHAPADENSSDPGAGNTTPHDADLARIARLIRLEVVEPARALPILSQSNWKDVTAYVQAHRAPRPMDAPRSVTQRKSFITRWFSENVLRNISSSAVSDDQTLVVTEILTADGWRRYHDDKLIDSGRNSLGRIPLVHIQNIAMPFRYSGTSEVEQLTGLQDELNTRLSDRAARITMQSFKMYLAKGLEDFSEMPIAPGRMWMTDNTAADIIEFGGDPENRGEDQHISELREAMDKTSGVTPIAAGAIRGRVGNLTSAAALRVTMIALLAKTERKRTVFGNAIQQMCELALAWLDCAGVLKTSHADRRSEVHWQGMLPDSEIDRLREAQIKRNLGVPKETILRELGYAPEQDTPTDQGK